MDVAVTARTRVLAALAAGAGVIHLAMVPAHMSEWVLEGIAFAVVGWLQVLVAVALVLRASRALEWWVAGCSLALVALWGLSRVVGLPIGPHAGVAETAAFVDLVCVGMEVALIVIVVGVVRVPVRTATAALVLPLALVALSGIAIASPSARTHDHDDAAAGAAHTHAVTIAGTSTRSGHTHGAASHSEVASLANGHTHPDDFTPYRPMDAATAKLLGEQLVRVREVTTAFPTVADARAAGFHLTGSFMPGQGAHFFPPRSLSLGSTPFDHPIAWLYAGTDPSSPVVGVMYGRIDFAGANERFHYHDDVCVGPVQPDGDAKTISESEGMSAARCTALGGQYIAHAGPLMHVWAVPGWESPVGVFSHDNPLVVCTDGQQPADVTQSKGGCRGLA